MRSSSAPTPTSFPYSKLKDAPHSDSETIDGRGESFEFNSHLFDLSNKMVRTGRQRKKSAARSKGSEFNRARIKKRRLYFCCISSEIDVQKLHDYLAGATGTNTGWTYGVICDVLHIFNPGQRLDYPQRHQKSASFANRFIPFERTDSIDGEGIPQDKLVELTRQTEELDHEVEESTKILGPATQDIFVYDFGVVVFWGFNHHEETKWLRTIRQYITKGYVLPSEFPFGEDDMAFISAESKSISIANDVITIPEDSTAKQRLSISFAIAQSAILAIFEARIEKKVEEYKHIPETLAVDGKIDLNERELGKMIGKVFVIRHDVNLHTEILDTPDFFWKEEDFLSDYKLTMAYLEMSQRTEVLNKRLDMLRELLDVLQQMMENAHGVNLEWIVIWLIVVEVLLQFLAIGGPLLGLWSTK